MNSYNELQKLLKNDIEYTKKKKNTKKKLIKLIILEIVIVLIVVLAAYQSTGDLNTFLSTLIIALSYAFITGASYYSYFSNQDYEMEMEKKQIEIRRLKEYSESIEVMYNDIRSLKHDYLNIFSSMLGFIEEEDFDGLKDYFSNNIIPINEQLKLTNTEIAKLSNIKILEIKGLVATKILKAQKLGINVRVDILDEISSIDMTKLELSRCLGILLDNAIEAAELSENGKMDFGIIKNDDSISIIISNSFAGELPPIHKIFEYGFSTKSGDRGIGMAYVKEITSKLDNVFLDIAKEGDQVVAYLEIINEKR